MFKEYGNDKFDIEKYMKKQNITFTASDGVIVKRYVIGYSSSVFFIEKIIHKFPNLINEVRSYDKNGTLTSLWHKIIDRHMIDKTTYNKDGSIKEYNKYVHLENFKLKLTDFALKLKKEFPYLPFDANWNNPNIYAYDKYEEKYFYDEDKPEENPSLHLLLPLKYKNVPAYEVRFPSFNNFFNDQKFRTYQIVYSADDGSVIMFGFYEENVRLQDNKYQVSNKDKIVKVRYFIGSETNKKVKYHVSIECNDVVELLQSEFEYDFTNIDIRAERYEEDYIDIPLKIKANKIGRTIINIKNESTLIKGVTMQNIEVLEVYKDKPSNTVLTQTNGKLKEYSQEEYNEILSGGY